MVRAYDLNIDDIFSWADRTYRILEIRDEGWLEVCEIRNGKDMGEESFNGYCDVTLIEKSKD